MACSTRFRVSSPLLDPVTVAPATRLVAGALLRKGDIMRWSRNAGMPWRRLSDRGATAVEYALIVGLVAGFIIGSVSALGATVASFFGAVTPWV